MSDALMIQGTVAVLMGGPGSEREVSLASGKAVAKALRDGGVEVVEVDVKGPEFELPVGCVLAFNLIHGTFGEDGDLQAELEKRGIPYTGAGRESSRIAFDKHLAKEKFVAAGVPTPASETVNIARGERPGMALPYVVKSPCQGSSVGVYIVKTPEQAEAAFADVSQYGDLALVEAFVTGRELTVGIFDDAALPVVEIVPPDGVYDMASKYPWLSGAQGSQYFCPAALDEATTLRVQAAALAAHRALGVEIYSRVDVLLDGDGEPFVLEANTIPGMTETSLLPKSAAAAGLDFGTLCLRIGERSLALGARC
ncbi:D-alanine-D-alanine ligase [Haloferula luteola]|uniref:D-alanine--D-alanine ligase n=1 Tax=Haloferula luteola TaxID=595692 RepID=A0A840V470_9BACT|nr:D-alanine--D-alanine ligase [Haloferula luteola]MBB5352333.1 D-alanine-D-alanine ligase [Haloferula luteola]